MGFLDNLIPAASDAISGLNPADMLEKALGEENYGCLLKGDKDDCVKAVKNFEDGFENEKPTQKLISCLLGKNGQQNPHCQDTIDGVINGLDGTTQELAMCALKSEQCLNLVDTYHEAFKDTREGSNNQIYNIIGCAIGDANNCDTAITQMLENVNTQTLAKKAIKEINFSDLASQIPVQDLVDGFVNQVNVNKIVGVQATSCKYILKK